MFCSKCGNQLDEGVAFCPKCGTKVGAVKKNTKAREKGFFCKKVLPLLLLVVIAVSLLLDLLMEFNFFPPYTIHYWNDEYFGTCSPAVGFFTACSWNSQGFVFRDLFVICLVLSIIVYVIRNLKKATPISSISFIEKNFSLISFVIALASLVAFVACSLSLFSLEIVNTDYGSTMRFSPYYFFYVIILIQLYIIYIPFEELYKKKSVAKG